ncbi:MAG: hypothetical protein QOH35_3870, partial [Acidobacteriaceae bacterium]|nr:hypothetical protein [Acidobacteriaceae bacterium]
MVTAIGLPNAWAYCGYCFGWGEPGGLNVGFDIPPLAPAGRNANSVGKVSHRLTMLDRRKFIQTAALAATATHLKPLFAQSSSTRSPNDAIQLALIGAGIQGQHDTSIAVQVPGVRLVAVADCYDGRLAHSKELWGPDVFTTRDYREILARKDVDAVLIATPDHWHKTAAVDAMKAGKDVFLEKPMIHIYPDGP